MSFRKNGKAPIIGIPEPKQADKSPSAPDAPTPTLVVVDKNAPTSK